MVGGWEKHGLVVPLIYALTDGFQCVPWRGIKPSTPVYWDDALINWAAFLTCASLFLWLPLRNTSLNNPGGLSTLTRYCNTLSPQFRSESKHIQCNTERENVIGLQLRKMVTRWGKKLNTGLFDERIAHSGLSCIYPRDVRMKECAGACSHPGDRSRCCLKES